MNVQRHKSMGPSVSLLMLGSVFFFSSNIRDYIKEGRVLLLLFPSLSLSLLTGPLKYGVCVCCFVLFVLSGCYVVMLCVKRNKKNVDKKRKAEHRGATIMYSVWKIMCFLNLEPRKHIALHQIHQIMFFLATSYDPFNYPFSILYITQ